MGGLNFINTCALGEGMGIECFTRKEIDKIREDARNAVPGFLRDHPSFRECLGAKIISMAEVEYWVLDNTAASLLGKRIRERNKERKGPLEGTFWEHIGTIVNATANKARERFYSIYTRIMDYHDAHVNDDLDLYVKGHPGSAN